MIEGERRLVALLALSPVPVVGTSLPSFLYVRALGGLRRALMLIIANLGISSGIMLLLSHLIPVSLAYVLAGINLVAGLVGALLGYKASSPKTVVKDGYLEIWIPVSTFGINDATPEEAFQRLVERAEEFVSPYYKEHIRKAMECSARLRVIVNSGEEEMRVSKRCNDVIVSVRRKGKKAYVLVTVPY
ncbi:MAG: hypothetical protein ACP5HQ_07845 [Thermoprotei archaeon]